MEQTTPSYGTDNVSEGYPSVDFKVISFLSQENPEFEELHKHHYFEIIWLRNGEGIHEIDLYSYPYKGSVIYVLAPGQIHKIRQKISSDGYIIKFLPSVFNDEESFFDTVLDSCIFNTVTSCPGILVPENMQEQLSRLFLNIEEEYKKHDTTSKDMYNSYLKLIIANINRAKKNSNSEKLYKHDLHYSQFRKFKIEIEKYYRKEHGVQFYADILNVETRLLNTISKKYINKSAREIIRERILLEAQRNLFNQSKSIKEISFELGFEDPAYFTRFFKKNKGLSPQNYRISLEKVIALPFLKQL